MSSSRHAWLGSLLGVVALGCAPTGDVDRIETKQSAVTAELFHPSTITPAGAVPLATATGDLNGDGRTDVAITTGSRSGAVNPNSLYVFLQAADGTLQPGVVYPLGNWPQSIDIGDVNGDGRADVVVGNSGSETIGVLLQNAAGTLDPMTAHATPRVHAVKIGDFNSDGRMDVASVNWDLWGYSGDGVDILLQTAAGTLAPPITYPVSYGGYSSLAVGDVNGDGRTDIAVVGDAPSFPNVGVLLQQADGTMATPVYYASVGAGGSNGSVAIGDVNGDGLADVVVSYRDGAGGFFIGRFLQNAQHTLNAVESFASRPSPIPIMLADVDGDGRKDVLAAHLPYVNLGVYRQTAAGGLGTEEFYGISNSIQELPSGLAVGDINGDTLPDVIVAGYTAGLVLLMHVDDVPPTVAITAPPSGNYCPGVALELTWTASDNAALAGFDVSVSYDGGTSYAPVSGCTGLASTARACSFVPAASTPRLRVTASDASSNSAQAETSITVGPRVQLDQSSYAPRATISVSYSCLPGGATDWLGVAAAGAANTSFLSYVYTGGNTSGTATLMAPASAGSYVVRAFPNNTFNVLTETAFSVAVAAPAVSTNASTYASGASITVTYSNLPGNATDWIGVAVAGAANTSFLSFVYTGGNKSGTATLAAPAAAGSYVVRAFPNNTFNLLAESPQFSVTAGSPSVSTNAASYGPRASITVTYAHLPGGAADWIGVAVAGSPSTSYLSYAYTGGNKSGTVTLMAPSAGGSYVVRAFPNNTFSVLAEAPFSVSVAPTVSTNAATYAPGASIAVTYSNLPGYSTDWIGVALAGSPNTSYITYVYTGGNQSGTAVVTAPASAGAYVIRAFPNNTYDLIAETPFTVSAGP